MIICFTKVLWSLKPAFLLRRRVSHNSPYRESFPSLVPTAVPQELSPRLCTPPLTSWAGGNPGFYNKKTEVCLFRLYRDVRQTWRRLQGDSMTPFWISGQPGWRTAPCFVKMRTFDNVSGMPYCTSTVVHGHLRMITRICRGFRKQRPFRSITWRMHSSADQMSCSIWNLRWSDLLTPSLSMWGSWKKTSCSMLGSTLCEARTVQSISRTHRKWRHILFAEDTQCSKTSLISLLRQPQ